MVFRHSRERRHDRERRRIRDGDEYTIDEEDQIEREEVEPRPAPPVDIQGEPWGWTKPGPRPEGWREDGRYGPCRAGDPGPLDGQWPEDSDGPD